MPQKAKNVGIDHRTIHHYGPDPEYVGGMGSVIRVLTEHQLGGGKVISHPTWRPDSRFASLPLAFRAAFSIPRSRKDDIVHVHLAEDGAFIREGAIIILARILGKVTVITLHGADFLQFAHRRARLTSRILRRAHLIICLDQNVLHLVRQIAPQAQSEIVPNPVAIGNSRGADETNEIVLFAGEISLRKGADVLCRAWRLVRESRPQARCIMVGPVSDFVVPEIAGLEVHGPVNAKRMKTLLHLARVITLPSRAEGMPMILTEAMSGGRPFISTPVGGIPELARGGGRLVPVDDELELARHLIELLANPALARDIGERGRQFCQETRSVEVIDIRLRELYLTATQV